MCCLLRRALGRPPISTRSQVTPAEDQQLLLATVLDQTHDCIKLLDAEGRIAYVNRQGAAAMELSEPSDLLGLTWLDRWPPESRAKIAEALGTARHGRRARFHAFRPRPDGSPSWWDVTVAPVAAPDGDETHFLTIARDASREVIEHERVEAISAEMRHRLKNALMIASALVRMEARDKPDVATFADAVTARFAHLARAQELILDPRTANSLAEVVPMLATAYGDAAALEFGIQLQALALTFGELCTNSLKYGALKNGRKVRIDAEDNGTHLIMVWNEDTAITAKRSGGQGLRLIDRIVQASGGTVERSEAEGSLVVRLLLPYTRGPSD